MKRVKIAIAIVALALIGVIVWQVARQREPVYKGRTLTSWLRDDLDPNLENHHGTYEALLQIGTNGIPTYLRLLRKKDSALKVKVIGWVDRQKLRKNPFISAERWNAEGMKGFYLLRTNARAAVPDLIEIAKQNISADSQELAISSLGYIGPPAKAAVPFLLQTATNANYRLRYAAVWSLGKIHSDPSRVVPALTNALSDTNSVIVFTAAYGLGEFGPEAKPAVPYLLQQYATNTDASMQLRVRMAPRAIDPEAAAKAGIK